MRKVFIAFLLMTCFLLIAGAGGQKENQVMPESEKTEITYFTFSAAPDHLDHLDEMIAIFEEKNKDIKIIVETAGWDDYFNKLQVNIAGGIAPDVFELNYENYL